MSKQRAQKNNTKPSKIRKTSKKFTYKIFHPLLPSPSTQIKKYSPYPCHLSHPSRKAPSTTLPRQNLTDWPSKKEKRNWNYFFGRIFSSKKMFIQSPFSPPSNRPPALIKHSPDTPSNSASSPHGVMRVGLRRKKEKEHGDRIGM